MNHFITLQAATEMTTRYRGQKELLLDTAFRNKNLLPICETFDRAAFDSLLATPSCCFIRIYFGMAPDGSVRLVIVAADAKSNDLLPATTNSTNAAPGENSIVEEGQRCPDICPPPGPLNG